MNDKVKTLLCDIQQWMLDNDYECGEEGGMIYKRIETMLKPPSKTCPTCGGRGYYQEGGTMSQFIDCDCEGFK